MHVGKVRERHLQTARRDIFTQSDVQLSAASSRVTTQMRLGLVVKCKDPFGERQKSLALWRRYHASRGAAKQ
jgi:hypothetical protein